MESRPYTIGIGVFIPPSSSSDSDDYTVYSDDDDDDGPGRCVYSSDASDSGSSSPSCSDGDNDGGGLLQDFLSRNPEPPRQVRGRCSHVIDDFERDSEDYKNRQQYALATRLFRVPAHLEDPRPCKCKRFLSQFSSGFLGCVGCGHGSEEHAMVTNTVWLTWEQKRRRAERREWRMQQRLDVFRVPGGGINVRTGSEEEEYEGEVQEEEEEQEVWEDEVAAEQASQEFVVEKILAANETDNGAFEYQILWKDLPRSESTSWEPEENIIDKTLITDFWGRSGKDMFGTKPSGGRVDGPPEKTPADFQLETALDCLLGRGVVVKRDTRRGMAMLKAVAHGGSIQAMLEVGEAYEVGQNGMPKDGEKAAQWYRKASDQGSAEGMFRLGEHYHGGANGLARNPAKAARLYLKSAVLGCAAAQVSLGCCYEFGDGVSRDSRKAIHWYSLAADRGNELAQYLMGVRYSDGAGVGQDYAKAARLFQLAADRHDRPSQRALGLLYAFGRGVHRDCEMALHWLQRSRLTSDPLVSHVVAEIESSRRCLPMVEAGAVESALQARRNFDAGDFYLHRAARELRVETIAMFFDHPEFDNLVRARNATGDLPVDVVASQREVAKHWNEARALRSILSFPRRSRAACVLWCYEVLRDTVPERPFARFGLDVLREILQFVLPPKRMGRLGAGVELLLNSTLPWPRAVEQRVSSTEWGALHRRKIPRKVPGHYGSLEVDGRSEAMSENRKRALDVLDGGKSTLDRFPNGNDQGGTEKVASDLEPSSKRPRTSQTTDRFQISLDRSEARNSPNRALKPGNTLLPTAKDSHVALYGAGDISGILPLGIFSYVLSFLNLIDIMAFTSVSRDCRRQLLSHGPLWRALATGNHSLFSRGSGFSVDPEREFQGVSCFDSAGRVSLQEFNCDDDRRIHAARRAVRRYGWTAKRRKTRCIALGQPAVAEAIKSSALTPGPVSRHQVELALMRDAGASFVGGENWCQELKLIVHGPLKRFNATPHQCASGGGCYNARSGKAPWCCPCFCDCFHCPAHGFICKSCMSEPDECESCWEPSCPYAWLDRDSNGDHTCVEHRCAHNWRYSSIYF